MDYRALNDENGIPSTTLHNPPLYFVLQCRGEKEWTKLEFPYEYEAFVAKAREIYPFLTHNNFTFTDECDAKLNSDFLREYVQMSSRGVVLKIKEEFDSNSGFHELKRPASTSESCHTLSTVTYFSSTDNDTDLENITLQPNLTNKKNTLKRKLKDDFISKEILLEILNKHSCGKDIVKQYDQDHYLTDKSRKILVKIVVDHMLRRKENCQRPFHADEKCKYAQTIIEVFPKLRDPKGLLGHEQFYDPKTNTGYLASRLSNSQRGNSKKKFKLQADEQKSTEIEETDLIKDAISYLKSAVPIFQEKEIIEKTKFTFAYRRQKCMNESFFNQFPRFADTPKLIDVEFELLYPSIEQNIFIEEFGKFANAIKKLYDTEKEKTNIFGWDRLTDSLIALTQLLPPVARGKNKASREKAVNTVDKFIIFKESGTPLQLTSEEKSKQPKLIAAGPNKQSIQQYFIAVDDFFILLPATDIIAATDALFKASFVFNTQFDDNLISFWLYIQHYFYGMDCKITPKIIDVHTKICAINDDLDSETQLDSTPLDSTL